MRLVTVLVLIIVNLPASAGQTPRLAVVVSFDQFRGDYAKKFSQFIGSKGFARIALQGAVLSKCFYHHAGTATGPGHAALLTGCDPYRSGITSNYFCDTRQKQCGYCATDSNDVVSPIKLEASTIGDVLRSANAKSKVIGISIKDRASVLMAGHNPTAVVWVDKETKNYTTSSYYDTPVWLSSIKQLSAPKKFAGKTWNTVIPQSKNPAEDDVRYEGTMSTGRRTFPYKLPKFDSEEFYSDFVRSPFSMQSLFNAAFEVIAAEKLGSDNLPDLLCIGVSTTDFVGHTFGPDSREVQELYVYADQLVARLIDSLDERVGRKNYVLIITSDHGVSPVPEVLKNDNMPGRPAIDAGRYKLSQLVRGVDSVLNKRFGTPPSGTWISMADEPSIFLSESAIAQQGVDRRRTVDAACAWLQSLNGIGIVARKDRMLVGDCPDGIADEDCKLLRNSFHPSRSGDIMIFPKRYWVITADAASHGSTHDYDRWVPLMLLGGPVKKQTSGKLVSPTDIASTLAQWWNLAMPPTDGSPLPLK
ncbi:MAG: alkaline phosphatase family protein [Ignavibacteria bacterium]|nr:alkaline phosphatase family protein [Ignavibacteria bacterium]